MPDRINYVVSDRPAWLTHQRAFWETLLPDGTVVRCLDRAVHERALEAAKRPVK